MCIRDSLADARTLRTELCRSVYADVDAEGEGEEDGGGAVAAPAGCHGAGRCAFAHRVSELAPTRRRRHPTAAHVADQFALWLARSVGAAALEGGGGEGEADDDAPLTIEQFRGWYAAYLAEARHVGAPHWRPVLLMMARHGLLRVAGAKKKGSFDGWAARPLLLEAAADLPVTQ